MVKRKGCLCPTKCKVPNLQLVSSHGESLQTKRHQSAGSFDVSMESKTKTKQTFLLEEIMTNKSLESQDWMNLLICFYWLNNIFFSLYLIGLGCYFWFCIHMTVRVWFFLSYPFSQWICWLFQIWKIQIILSEGKQGWYFLPPDFFCCHVGYACLCWNREHCMFYQWWSCSCGFVKRHVMGLNLKLSSFYCLLRQKVIFKFPSMCHSHVFSILCNIIHLPPSSNLRTGKPTSSKSKAYIKNNEHWFCGVPEQFLHWGVCAGLFLSICFRCLTFIVDIPAINP